MWSFIVDFLLKLWHSWWLLQDAGGSQAATYIVLSQQISVCPSRKAKSELGRLQLELSTRQAVHCWSQTLSQWQWFLIDLPQQFCVLLTIKLIPWCEEFMLKMCKSWFHPLISFDCFSGDLSQICWQKSRRRCSSEKPQKSNGWKSGWTACLLLLNHRSH